MLLIAGALTVAIVLPAAAQANHKSGHQGGSGNAETLSLGATPNPLVFGRSTVLSGRLTGNNKAGRTVHLDGAPYPYTSFVNDIATTTTGPNGGFSFARRPSLNTRYRVRVGALSSSTTVLVRQRVSLFLSDSTPRRGQLVRFSGRSCPTHDGAIVSIQKRTSTGSFRTVRRTRLRDASRCSVYSRRLRIFTDGVFRTVVARDADHARGFSRRRSVDAHR
jgi:hypothetical protein